MYRVISYHGWLEVEAAMNLTYVNEIDVQLNQFVHVLIYFQSHVHVSYLGML